MLHQIHFEKKNLQGSHDHAMGGGMLGKPSKIVILCCYASIFYLIIIKIFRILKIVYRGQCPLVREVCGVTHQLQMLELPLTRWHDWKEVNKYGGSCPRGQSLLRYQPVCL